MESDSQRFPDNIQVRTYHVAGIAKSDHPANRLHFRSPDQIKAT